MKKFVAFACLPLILAGCSLKSINTAPMPSVTASVNYTQEISETKSVSARQGAAWWTDLNRPNLNILIENALQTNFDVAQAVARLRQAEAVARQSRSTLFPQIDLTGRASDDWEGSDGQRGEASIGAALSWEIDAFGRLSSTAQADLFRAQARREDVDALKLFLSADIATAYFGAAAAQRTLDLLNAQVRTDQDLLELLQLRFDEGIGTRVEVLQQQSRVAESQSLIPRVQADLRVFENRLDVLTGTMPDAQNRVPEDESLDFAQDLPLIGIPADLLLNRPDLRAARNDLIAADADIASAIADRLPRLTFEGSYLFSDAASYTGPVAAIMGMFVQPLLDWGRRKAEVERNEALYEERLAAFTQTYLEAAEETENALYQENRQREFLMRLESRRALLQETVSETEARFKQGVDDYLPVLNALQELRNVERDLIAEQLNLIGHRIALHRATGGFVLRPQGNSQGE